MSLHDSPDPTETSQAHESRRTRLSRPLWELELLISGAVIFSLFRIPGVLQDVFFRVEAQISMETFFAPFMLFYFANLVTLALIVSFSIHFLLRSFWVALAGLNEVFPEGIDWQRLDVSPIAKKIFRERFPTTADLEHKLDRIASTVFSVLFFVILQVLVLSLIFGVLATVLAPLRRLLAPEMHPNGVLWIILVVLIAPLLAGALVDRWFKKDPRRLDRHPGLGRLVERLLRLQHRLFLSALYLPIQLTFASRFSSRSTTIASTIAMFSVVGLFLVSLLVGRGAVGFDSYVFFPEAGSSMSIDSNHYESLLAERPKAGAPTIQDQVIQGDFVQLFIPYLPKRDAKRMAEVCPKVEPLRREGFFVRRNAREIALTPQREAKLLRCLGSLYRIELNGKKLAPEFSFYRRSGDDSRGLLAFLATDGLPRGKNLLVVERSPTKKQLAEARDAADRGRLERRGKAYIPFWR